MIRKELHVHEIVRYDPKKNEPEIRYQVIKLVNDIRYHIGQELSKGEISGLLSSSNNWRVVTTGVKPRDTRS